ncbi:LytTR family DNA-binding domain-containing protein [Flavobacterium litorale]|uniref:LytTR family transcriptional regulator n=1 Tax=Flavobacterium litorale TaxID=2856519 RepID=A0ABX8VCW6_9FLAO|nr:LytTR family DNA-binding domain-containing protein [Flavobacterium litorale]QYJ68486.1 LytTR family transcriptional regulator [Flavobacterium litorale]
MLKKLGLEFIITIFLAIFLHSLIDIEVFSISNWRRDNVVNLLHLWLTMLSGYYIYNKILQWSFKQWDISSAKKLITLLLGISVLITLYVIVTDVLFYKLYYDITSLKKETTFFEFDLPITIVVLTFGGLLFFQRYYNKPIPKTGSNTTVDENIIRIKAHKGKGTAIIDIEEVSIFYINNGIVWLQTLNGEKYHTDYTLTALLEIVDSNYFFRLNRQAIVQKKAIKEFRKLEFQKLEVILNQKVNYNTSLIVSKYTAPTFKKWLTNSG